MRTGTIISPILVAAVAFWSGCDSAGISDDGSGFVRPTISVHFVNAAHVFPAGKLEAILDVELTVETLSGLDFSPEPIQVDNETTSEVSFDLLLPPDSLYRFGVRFTDGGNLVGEGAVLEQISATSTEVDIPVVSTSGESWLALVPAVVNVPKSGTALDLVLRYYGDDAPIAGLATRIDMTGPSPVTVEYMDVDVVEPGPADGQVSLAWQFTEDISGANDVATVRVPRSNTAEFCLEMGAEDTRVVDRDGLIRIIGGSGACIDVK